MNPTEMEFLAFLSLCGEHDKEILLKQRNMTFEDFERLEFLSERLGFNRLNTILWNHYSQMFEKKFQYLLKLLDERILDMDPYEDMQYEWEKQDRWLAEFLEAVPDKIVSTWIQSRL